MKDFGILVGIVIFAVALLAGILIWIRLAAVAAQYL